MSTSPHVLLALGLGKPKPKGGPPPSVRDRLMGPSSSSAAPGQDAASSPVAPSSSATHQQGMGGKASRDDAGFIPAGQNCGDCIHYTKESGDCSDVEGTFKANDSCKNYFQHANPNGASMPGQQVEPDQDDSMMAMGNSGRP